jgi:DNA mismatch repair ATPase MutS
VLEITLSFSPVLERAAALLASMDVLAAFAQTGVEAPVPYTRPVLKAGHACLFLAQTRHALLEERTQALTSSTRQDFVPNDLLMQRGASHVQA